MGRYCMARSITCVSPALITRRSKERGKSRTAMMHSTANSRQAAAATEQMVLMRFISRLPQYWEISTTAPVARPLSPAVTKVVMALLCATADKAYAPVRVTITLSAMTTSSDSAL